MKQYLRYYYKNEFIYSLPLYDIGIKNNSDVGKQYLKILF